MRGGGSGQVVAASQDVRKIALVVVRGEVLKNTRPKAFAAARAWIAQQGLQICFAPIGESRRWRTQVSSSSVRMEGLAARHSYSST